MELAHFLRPPTSLLRAGVGPPRPSPAAVVRAQGTVLAHRYGMSTVRAPSPAPEDLTVGTMIDALGLVGTERVLEIGSPTADTAATLSGLAAEVYSVVSDPELAERRGRHLHALGCRNVHVVLAPPEAGWPEAAPYQAILVGAAAAQVPLELIHQLELGGRLVISIGDETGQLLERVYKGQGALKSETLGTSHLGMLAHARQTPSCVPWVPPSRGSRL